MNLETHVERYRRLTREYDVTPHKKGPLLINYINVCVYNSNKYYCPFSKREHMPFILKAKRTDKHCNTVLQLALYNTQANIPSSLQAKRQNMCR